MSEANTGAEFLKQRHPGLANSYQVRNAAKGTKARTGLEVPRLPEVLIQNYLDRLKEIIECKDPEKRTKDIAVLKKNLIKKYVVRIEDVPDSYWQAQMKVTRGRGESGDWQSLSEKEQLEQKRKHLAQTKEDQRGSLEEWIDYFASDKSAYLPVYLKYWAFQGMLRLERYEKGNEEKGIKGRFPERPTGRQRSIKMFPEVNERALKFIASAYEAQAKNQGVSFRCDISSSAQSEFLEHLKKKDFRSLYGWGQEHIPPISEEEMQITEGKWTTYKQNSDSRSLTATLRGKGSGWCIAGENLAREYLSRGNLYVYYTRDREGKTTIPRVVIVQSGNMVTEVRGIEWQENMDNYIKDSEIIGDKLREIPGGERFFEIDADVKHLTAIDKKTASGGLLTKEELTFLYEKDSPIKYFGYKKDPRIDELRSQRNIEEDMLIIFNCEKNQLAKNPSEINENTKAYVGSLLHRDRNGKIIPIFELLRKYNVEQVYTSFPEGKITFEDLEIGGKTKTELEKGMKDRSIKFDYVQEMLDNRDFTTLKTPQTLHTAKLRVQDLGFPENEAPTTDQIYARAKDLGLNLCPAETGPHKRLKDTSQPLNDWYYIAMKQVTDRYGYPRVFELGRNGGGLWLHDGWAEPDHQWGPGDRFVFASNT